MFNFTKFFYQMTFEQKNIFLKVTKSIYHEKKIQNTMKYINSNFYFKY